ncbi:MAG: hypothetical protein DDT23_00733 [candidate division WS2 bacterium]|nr:hypothetical protein [Candidatus Lithacetigena glycinireducens]
MHPVCPLSLSHARIFVLADVWARWKRKQGFSVRFPICMHYSGSTVFKITNAVSNFLQKQKLNDVDKKTLDLIFNFYKIPKKHLHKFTEPISVLDYFSDIILKDLRSIQVSCDYNDYFNTTNQRYQEFVCSVFDIYREKRFITIHNNNKSLNYPDLLFRNLAVNRLNETKFSLPTAKAMVAESLDKLDDEWSFERNDSIGTCIDEYIIDPMFDAEFLSIFNAIYPYLKDLAINQSNARDIFKEFLHKIKNPDKKVSSIASELYSNSQEILPIDIFFVERHLQNWVAKRIYTETILLPPHLSTHEYFFLGSITKNSHVDSASRGHGTTLSQLIEIAGPENARLTLLLSFGAPHKDYEWASTTEHIKRKLTKFNKFVDNLKRCSIDKKHQYNVTNTLKGMRKEIENLIECGNTRKILLLIFDELPKVIQPMLTNSSQKNNTKKVLSFLGEYLNILCPSLNSKLYEN